VVGAHFIFTKVKPQPVATYSLWVNGETIYIKATRIYVNGPCVVFQQPAPEGDLTLCHIPFVFQKVAAVPEAEPLPTPSNSSSVAEVLR
jgi:hypothetical protein